MTFNKHIGIIIIGFIVAVVLTSGCVEIDGDINQLLDYFLGNDNYKVEDTSYKNLSVNTPTETFSAYGVSFNHPSNWIVNSDNQTGGNMIFASKDISLNGVQFQIQLIPNNGMPEEKVNRQFEMTLTPGWEKKSSYLMIINNETAYEDVYFVNDTNFHNLRMTTIHLVKNDTTYLITLQAPDKDFDKEKPYFAMILNSLKIQ